jgi:hypothetical protein
VSDKSSKTITAGELIRQLQKVDPSTPVVMTQNDEPCGDYGVRSVEFTDMKRQDTYAAEPFGMDVWHEAEWLNEFPNSHSHKTFDPPQAVVFLGHYCPWKPTIDAEIAQAEIEA